MNSGLSGDGFKLRCRKDKNLVLFFFFFTPRSHTKIIPAFIRKVPGSRFELGTEYDEWRKIRKEAPVS